MKKILDWVEHRTGYRSFMHEALYERVPGGSRWRYVWGSTLVFAFVVQMVTGFFLWTAYSPNSQGAWESVYYIQHEMVGGWLLRGVHHFMAQAMIVLLALHFMQVIVDGAYKAPREVNFWLGLILMMIVLGLSLTGYLLPWDQKGFWATKVATNIMGITPVIGPELQKVVVGGTEYGHHTLTRFFAIHAGLLPALLIGFLVLHIYVFRRHGITAHKPDPKKDAAFWPDQVLKDAVACLGVLAVVLLLVFQPFFQGKPIGPELGAHLSAPADGAEKYSAARPEWYFLFLFQLLKYFPGETEVIGAHILPGTVLLFMFLMPFLGKWKLGHRFNIAFMLIIFGAASFLTWQAIQQDSRDPSFEAANAEASRAAERVPLLVKAYGTRTDGAVALVRNDPYLQGPKIFAKKCASCHRYNGHDGTGQKVMELKGDQLVETAPTAADLGNFGTREWSKNVLLNFSDHFKDVPKTGKGKEQTLFSGQMADWSKENNKELSKPENQESLDALVDFLVAQSGRKDLPAVDATKVKKGRDIFANGTLANGATLSTNCSDCHGMRAKGETTAISANVDYPDLTGYGSAAWLKSFIASPGSKQHYGTANQMPGFESRLTEQEMSLLVRWMVGDYYVPKEAGTEH